jgi:hypothetical protein
LKENREEGIMSEMGWKKAINKVLEEAETALHYCEITRRIIDGKLRTSYVATPDSTVNAQITGDIAKNKTKSPYWLISIYRYP